MSVKTRNIEWRNFKAHPGRQAGAITIFTAVLILILLTEMVFYAVQVGVFEQRKSGNEMRQKQAFHAAETGIQAAQAYLLSNALDITYGGAEGWLSDVYVDDGGNGRWVPCADASLSGTTGTHPCFGEPLDSSSAVNLRDTSYFYSLDGENPADLPVQAGNILPDSTETVTVQALLCLLDLDRTPGVVPVKGCLLKGNPNVNDIYFVITLLARGQAECDGGNCAGETLVAQKLGSFGPLTGAGGPGVPLTSRSSFPPGGTAEIVPNPNGGGTGVPISSWINNNDGLDPYTGLSCSSGVDPAVDPNGGSWTTCEMHEWYGVDAMPDENSPNGKYTCPSANCSCGTAERRISYGDANGFVKGIDIIIDDNFPCDLFEYTFNVPRTDYLDVKTGPGVKVITDCDELGPDSFGTYWVDGSVDTCRITASDVGSPGRPVFIISAAELFSLAGNANIYGVLFVTDVEGSAGEFQVSGTNTLYGAAIIDGAIGNFTGTYQVVWNEDLIDRATKTGAIGKIYGGWTDFHEDWR